MLGCLLTRHDVAVLFCNGVEEAVADLEDEIELCPTCFVVEESRVDGVGGDLKILSI